MSGLPGFEDMTWRPVTAIYRDPANPGMYVAYSERRVRDWRWLWLRRRMEVKFLGWGQMSDLEL